MLPLHKAFQELFGRRKKVVKKSVPSFGAKKCTQAQGCQMAYFQNKNPSLGKFWRFLQWKMLVYYMAIWSILLPFGIFCDHFGIFYVYSYIFSPVRYVVPKKSGNPGQALISQVEESQKEIKISSNFLSEKPHLRPKSILMCESRYIRTTWDRCYDFKNIFAKKIAKTLTFLTQNELTYANFCHNIGF
jgi:hypothetical protein